MERMSFEEFADFTGLEDGAVAPKIPENPTRNQNSPESTEFRFCMKTEFSLKSTRKGLDCVGGVVLV